MANTFAPEVIDHRESPAVGFEDECLSSKPLRDYIEDRDLVGAAVQKHLHGSLIHSLEQQIAHVRPRTWDPVNEEDLLLAVSQELAYLHEKLAFCKGQLAQGLDD